MIKWPWALTRIARIGRDFAARRETKGAHFGGRAVIEFALSRGSLAKQLIGRRLTQPTGTDVIEKSLCYIDLN
jgi:hypothetical protein